MALMHLEKVGIYTSDQSGFWTMPCGPVPKSEAEMKQKGEGSGTSYEKELPLPIMLFRSFVGTFGNLSVHVHVCKPSSMSFV